jgi:hypothetical protein
MNCLFVEKRSKLIKWSGARGKRNQFPLKIDNLGNKEPAAIQKAIDSFTARKEERLKSYNAWSQYKQWWKYEQLKQNIMSKIDTGWVRAAFQDGGSSGSSSF